MELSLEKYSRPLDLSQFETCSRELSPLRPPLGEGESQCPLKPQLYLLNPRKLNLYDKTVVILSAYNFPWKTN